MKHFGPRELRERVGRGETAATSTSQASSLLQACFDEAVAMDYGVPRGKRWLGVDKRDLLDFSSVASRR